MTNINIYDDNLKKLETIANANDTTIAETVADIIKDHNEIQPVTKWLFDHNLLDEYERPFLYCTVCGSSIHPTENATYKFCPVCGKHKTY